MSNFLAETVGSAINFVSFGEAIKALKEGKMVCRKGWNGKGMFVFEQVPSVVPSEFIHKMSSLPQSVKDEFKNRLENNENPVNSLTYKNQLAIVKINNEINGWSPSVADSLANDWIILK